MSGLGFSEMARTTFQWALQPCNHILARCQGSEVSPPALHGAIQTATALASHLEVQLDRNI
jgi:hypothetical protein